MNFIEDNPVAFILVLTGFIFYLAAWIQATYPPKKINHFYGYRTKTSMKNQEIWDYAQQYSAEKLKNSGLLLILLGLCATFFTLNGQFEVWVAISIVTISPVYTLILVEKKLKKKDPKY
ncbi:SdpI family protein [Flavobacteriaceae bacterium]|nr:SdpI family protein [Flavobacteriaceae bacterium]